MAAPLHTEELTALGDSPWNCYQVWPLPAPALQFGPAWEHTLSTEKWLSSSLGTPLNEQRPSLLSRQSTYTT